MKKRLIGFWIMIMILIGTLCGNTTSVRAEEVKDLDLILVLDQSGSMNRNDPNGMMLEAAETLVSMMPVNVSRIGVISFNRKQTKVVELTGFSDANSVFDIRSSIGRIEYEGDTDIGNAVADAVEMFDLKDGREHAIMILSDGKNDFGGDRKAEVESDERLNEALASAKNSGCKIYALGFGPELQDKNGTAYKKLSSIVTSDDNISTETDPEKIKDFFTEMLADLTGVKIPQIYDNKIKIEPNVKEANIYLSSDQSLADVVITIEDPNGNSVDLENNDKVWFFKGEYVAVIKMFSPAPGVYTVGTSSDAVNITVGYIPSYEYILKSEIVNENEKPVTNVDNGTTAEIRTVICQDNKEVTDPEVYNAVDAKAVVTAKDTGETQEIPLHYSDGKLRGSVHFTRPALYSVDIYVESESFDLKDRIEIKADKREIAFKTGIDGIGNKTIDKTFKKFGTEQITNDELYAIIEDPDQVGFTVESVTSSDESKVTAEINSDGILLKGLKWGSSVITVRYRDSLGSTLTTSFKASVTDKLLIVLFAMMPILIGIGIAIIAAIILNRSRAVRGSFTITHISVRDKNQDDSMNSAPITVEIDKEYNAKSFIGKKKTLGTGVTKYITDLYSSDNSSDAVTYLHKLFERPDSEMHLLLDEVKVVGTYLGLRGCWLIVRKGASVSLHDNRHYRQKKPQKYHMAGADNFVVYVEASGNRELCVKGKYSIGRVPGKGKASTKGKDPAGGKQVKNQQKPKGDFDDFF